MSFAPLPRPRSQTSSLCLLLTTIALSCALPASSQTPQPPAPDVVARVTAAKTIFLSNAGANDYFNGQIPGGPNVSYNELYAALQQWGYFHLTDSPAHADLIFQIRGAEAMPELTPAADGNIIPRQHAPRFELTILDPHSNPAAPTPIDTITAMAGRANDIPKGTIAFAQSIEWLTYQISKLVNVPPPSSKTLQGPRTLRPSFETLIQFQAPVPPQVLNARSIFVDNTASPNDPYAKALLADLNQWAHYRLADSAASADLVFHFHHTIDGIYLTLTAPDSNVILWTVTDPHYGFYRSHRVSALTQNLISELKQLNHLPLTSEETAALR